MRIVLDTNCLVNVIMPGSYNNDIWQTFRASKYVLCVSNDRHFRELKQYDFPKVDVRNLTATDGGTVTLYEKWTPTTYTITYNLNGGSVATPNPTSYTIETPTFTLNNPTKVGYRFTGWTGSNGNTPQTTVKIDKGSTEDRTYIAHYKTNNFTVGDLSYQWTSGTEVKVTACNSSATSVTIPTTVSYDDETFTVTAIDATAFSSCTSLAQASEMGANENDIQAIESISLKDAADNNSLITAANDNRLNVTLQDRTLYKDGAWNTLCLPFDVTIAGSVLDGTGVVARTLTEASITGTTLNLTFGDAVTTLTAGVPYIIKWTKDDENPTIDNPVFSGVTIDATDRSFTSGSGDTQVRFIGTYNSTTFTDEDRSILFLGAENKLYYPQPDLTTDPGNPKYPTIGAQRAYFKIGDGALARQLTAFNIDFGEGEAQGIMTTDYTDKAGAWYDLQGRRVSESGIRNSGLRHGIYIKNGRKVVVP